MTNPMRGPAPRVLLVDDAVDERSLLREMLEEEGFEVVGEAADGAEAVDLAARVRPDVVLMDLRMPNVGGIEATRRIKDAGSPAQVVMLTIYDDPLPTRSAMDVGAYAYLVKGCPPSLIRDVVVQAWKFKLSLEAQARDGSAWRHPSG